MKNQQLIQEVIAQISQRFAPKIPDIKKVNIILLQLSVYERMLIILFSGHRPPIGEGVH